MLLAAAALLAHVFTHMQTCGTHGVFCSDQESLRLQPMVYFADGAVQPQPVAGQQFVRVGNGDTVDIILQNLPANANGAPPPLAMDYRRQELLVCVIAHGYLLVVAGNAPGLHRKHDVETDL